MEVKKMRIIRYPVSNENLDLGELLIKLEEECDEFAKMCENIEQTYPNITFFGGNRKGDWKKLYQFKDKSFTDDNNNQWVSSMAPDARWYEKVCPRLYAMRKNKSNKQQAKELTNLYDFV